MSVFREDVLAGKTAFVTGGGSGICKGITETLMAHGANAVITSRKQERLDESARELAEKTGRECLGVACDVRDPATVEATEGLADLLYRPQPLAGVDVHH